MTEVDRPTIMRVRFSKMNIRALRTNEWVGCPWGKQRRGYLKQGMS